MKENVIYSTVPTENNAKLAMELESAMHVMALKLQNPSVTLIAVLYAMRMVPVAYAEEQDSPHGTVERL